MNRLLTCLLTLLVFLSSPATKGNADIWHSPLAAKTGLATGADEAIFWSGIGRGAADRAASWAAQNGGATRAFFSVQSEADPTRLASGGTPWPKGLQRANLGEGLYTWGTRAEAEAYAVGKGNAQILQFNMREADYAGFNPFSNPLTEPQAYNFERFLLRDQRGVNPAYLQYLEGMPK